MHVLVIGANQGVGLILVKKLYAKGDKVTALVRNLPDDSELRKLDITVLIADCFDEEAVHNALATCPKDTLIVSMLGDRNNKRPCGFIGNKNIIDNMEKLGLKRFLMVTSLSCGDSWKYASDAVKKSFGQLTRYKSLAESWLQTSELDYTILRPAGLLDYGNQNLGVLKQRTEIHGFISRDEVARLIIELLEDPSSINQIYSCYQPELTR